MTSDEEWERSYWIDSLIRAYAHGKLPRAITDTLVKRVQAGEEIYAYKAAGRDGPWNLWIEGRRIPIAEWLKGHADA